MLCVLDRAKLVWSPPQSMPKKPSFDGWMHPSGGGEKPPTRPKDSPLQAGWGTERREGQDGDSVSLGLFLLFPSMDEVLP